MGGVEPEPNPPAPHRFHESTANANRIPNLVTRQRMFILLKPATTSFADIAKKLDARDLLAIALNPSINYSSDRRVFYLSDDAILSRACGSCKRPKVGQAEAACVVTLPPAPAENITATAAENIFFSTDLD